jgi:hypothetical protein
MFAQCLEQDGRASGRLQKTRVENGIYSRDLERRKQNETSVDLLQHDALAFFP